MEFTRCNNPTSQVVFMVGSVYQMVGVDAAPDRVVKITQKSITTGILNLAAYATVTLTRELYS